MEGGVGFSTIYLVDSMIGERRMDDKLWWQYWDTQLFKQFMRHEMVAWGQQLKIVNETFNV